MDIVSTAVPGNSLGFIREESAGLPGRHITVCQMRLLRVTKKTQSVEVAAAKAGSSRVTGYPQNRDPSGQRVQGAYAPAPRHRDGDANATLGSGISANV